MVTILGINSGFHDSSICILRNGKVLYAIEEEKISRKKHDSSFPINAINEALKETNIKIQEIDIISFYEKPLLKLDRIITTFIETYPKKAKTFSQTFQKVIDSLLIRKKIRKLGYTGKIEFFEHHKSHAAYSYYTSGYSQSAILVIDALGEWTTTSIWSAKKEKIEKKWEKKYPNSLGLMYSTFTQFLGFKPNSDEGKIMGLSSYGSNRFEKEMKKILKIKNKDYALNLDYFDFLGKKPWTKKFENLFGKPRKKDEQITKRHADIAKSLQKILEKVIIELVKKTKNLTNTNNLCLGGGVFLNCVINQKIEESNIFENVFIPFAPTDAGSSIGSAFLSYYSIKKFSPKKISPYLGSDYTSLIKKTLDEQKISYKKMNKKKLIKKIAKEIRKNKIVAWYQSKTEFGPRALGNRSILANPDNPHMRKLINRKIKFREEFRPFAPSILQEKSDQIFKKRIESPYMIRTYKNLTKKICSATHVDKTCRVHTITKKANQKYYELIEEFYDLTGTPALLNTSLNIQGEPIVNTPLEALNFFKKTKTDILVLDNYIIIK